MSIRVDSSSLIAGAIVVGDPGLGVLAEEVPSTGEHGPGIAYTWLGPAEAGKEIRVLITQWPQIGSLFVWEDTSFEYDGPGDIAYGQLYVEGQPIGAPQQINFSINEGDAGGSLNNLVIFASGAGVSLEKVYNGAVSLLTIGSIGEGTALEKASSGSVSSLDISSQGAGTQASANSGGSISSLSMAVTGQGIAKEVASGSSTSLLSISTLGLGTALEKVLGGTLALLNISAVGAGITSSLTSGGSISSLSISRYGAGIASSINLSNLEITGVTSTSVSLRFLVTRG